MCNIYYIFLGIGIYLLGFVITYIITKRRANWATYYKVVDKTDEEFGVFLFSILSFVGLILFLLIRMFDILIKQIDKLCKL